MQNCELPANQKWVLAGLTLDILERLLAELREKGEIHVQATDPHRIPSLTELAIEAISKHK